MSDRGIIHAYHFDAGGNAAPLEMSENADTTAAQAGYDWIHLCATHPDTRRYLEQSSDLDPIVIDAILAEETRPRALIKPTGAMIILYAMNFYEGQNPEDMISIRIWVDAQKVITTRQRDILAIHDINEAIAQGRAPATPCDLLIMITDRLFERMEPALEQLNEISYIFSVAAAVFLPLSFLTGLMGVNLGGMPGSDSVEAFWAFAGLCGLIITVQVLIFKKMKWF